MTDTTIPKKALVALPDFYNPANGVFRVVPPEEAFVPAFDRSFHFGDSLYEVCRTYEGVPMGLDDHFRRLRHSADLGQYAEAPDEPLIRRMIQETCRQFFLKYGNTEVYIRVTVSRGLGDLNIDPRYSSASYPLVFVKELELTASETYATGVHYAEVTRRRNPPEALDPAMKSGNYLNNVLAIAEARKLGASDALMLNLQGFVTEGTTNNVYIVKDKEIWTAPLSVGILAGITREWVLEVAGSSGTGVQERLFTMADTRSAEEMFLSSSTKEVLAITKLNGSPVGNGKPGPITQKIHGALRKKIQAYVKAHKSESLFI